MVASWNQLKQELEWFVSFRNPKEIWHAHWSYLVIEILFFICGFLTFKHACKKGGRNVYLWLAAALHGIVVETLSYLLPDNFWHAQSTIMFLGFRLPAYIILLYPVFIYTTCVAVNKLKLPYWAEPFAVGLAVVLLDVPFDILGIKCLWWTWHDTDPNIHDRHYWVPWTSYYFHASFAFSFSFIFRYSRSIILSENERNRFMRFLKEIVCVILVAILSTPLGILQFVLIYHGLHDLYKIHTEVCVLLLLSFYFLIVWTADRNPNTSARSERNNQLDEISLVVYLFYFTFAIIVAIIKPETQRSTGLHEPIGTCNEKINVHTPIGIILKKRKYLCLEDYDEAYDFHCVKKSDTSLEDNQWYTICGTPFPNIAEYIIIIWAFCCIGLYVYYQMLYKSGTDGSKMLKQKKIKMQ